MHDLLGPREPTPNGISIDSTVLHAGPPNMDDSIVFARWQQCACPCNTCFPGPTQVHNLNSISIGSAIFLHSSRICRYALQRSALSPLKIVPSHGRSGPHLTNTWFLRPTQILNPNHISIGSAVFARQARYCDRQTDRQTDHATRSVTIDHIYVRSTAIPPNK